MSDREPRMTLLAKDALVPVVGEGTDTDYLAEFTHLEMYHRECGLGRIRCRYYWGRDDLIWLEFFCTHCLDIRKIQLITALNPVKRFLTDPQRLRLHLDTVTLELVDCLP